MPQLAVQGIQNRVDILEAELEKGSSAFHASAANMMDLELELAKAKKRCKKVSAFNALLR